MPCLEDNHCLRREFQGLKIPLEVSQKGKEYLLKALKLDPLNAQAYSGLADYYLWMEWDLETALVNKLTSIELEPSNVLLQVSVIDVLLASGKFSEAIKRSESILKAEPTFYRSMAVFSHRTSLKW